MKTLFLVRGVSNSGKTTVAKQLASVCLAADDYFTDAFGNYNFDATKLNTAHEMCRERVKLYMTQDNNIAVHNTFTTEKEMQPYFDLAKEFDYKVVSIIVERRHEGMNSHHVPEETMKKQEAKLKQNIKLR